MVEDVTVLAMLAEAILESFGCEIVGRAGTVVRALDIIKTTAIDVALLDISLREGASFAIADALAERGVPYIFVTAHGRDQVPGSYSQAPLVQKPYDPVGLRSAVQEGLSLAGVA